MQASITCNRCNNVVLYDTDWNSSHICCPFCRNAVALSPAAVNFQGGAAAPQAVNNFAQNQQIMQNQTPANNQPAFNAQPNQYTTGQSNQYATGQPNQYATGQPNQYTPGQPNQYTPGQPNQYAPGQPNQYAPGQPNQYAPGQPNQYTTGQPNQYAPGQPNQYAPGQPTGENYQQYNNNGGYDEYVKASNTNPVYWLLLLLGYGCYVFAVIDFCGMFFNYDITGVPWSPIVASIIGGILHKLAGAGD